MASDHKPPIRPPYSCPQIAPSCWHCLHVLHADACPAPDYKRKQHRPLQRYPGGWFAKIDRPQCRCRPSIRPLPRVQHLAGYRSLLQRRLRERRRGFGSAAKNGSHFLSGQRLTLPTIFSLLSRDSNHLRTERGHAGTNGTRCLRQGKPSQHLALPTKGPRRFPSR